MFSKENSRILRETFWISFGKSFPRKWILYQTKIKGLAFKFHFDTKSAMVTLDIEGTTENRIKYWRKLQSLQEILINEYLPNAIFAESYALDNGKKISRVYVLIDDKVSIHNKESWQHTMVFFNETMDAFENFYDTYKDFISA